jgi:hypothetical protein
MNNNATRTATPRAIASTEHPLIAVAATTAYFPTAETRGLATRRTALGVHEAAHVLLALVGAATGDLGLLLVALLHLGRLVLHLTGTGERAVHLACAHTQTKNTRQKS